MRTNRYVSPFLTLLLACAASVCIVVPEALAQESAKPVFLVKSGDTIGGKVLVEVAGLQFRRNLSLNNSGDIAFAAWWDEDGNGVVDTSGIFTQNELLVAYYDLVAGHLLLPTTTPFINDSGVVAFFAFWDDDRNGIFEGNGIFTQHDVLFEDYGMIDGLTVEILSFIEPVLNNSGEVAFPAEINLSGDPFCDALSYCPSALVTTQRVLVNQGDVIDGTTVSSISAHFDFNDAEEFIFLAVDMTSEVFVATADEVLYKNGDVLNGRTLSALRDPRINDNGDIVVLGGFGDPISHEALLTRDGVLVEEGGIINGILVEDIRQTGGMNNLGEVVFAVDYIEGDQLRHGWFTQNRFLVTNPVMIEDLEVFLPGSPRINDSGDVVFFGVWDTDGAPGFEGSGIVLVAKNDPPVAMCHDVVVATNTGVCVADAEVDNGSSDPDGDAITLAQSPVGPYPLGKTPVTLTLTDDNGATDSCAATVEVIDDDPPSIQQVSVTPAILWPPNHGMTSVDVLVSSSDNCDVAICRIVSVQSNEPVDDSGDGNTDEDWVITGNLTAQLRAERSGLGSGRIYTMTVECADALGSASTATVDVTVPLSKK